MMEIKFDFEVDDRFQYDFDEEQKEFVIDSVRDGFHVFLKPLEEEMDKYNNGVFVIKIADKIKVLRDMQIPDIYEYNLETPIELWKRIRENLTYSRFLNAIEGFVKDAY